MDPTSLMQPPPETTVYTTSAAQIWIGEDGILRIRLLPGSMHGEREAREILGGVPPHLRYHLVLTDIRLVKAIRREARQMYRDPGLYTGEASALALLVGSPLSRAIGNFFIGLSRMPMPTRLFTSEEEAVRWLKSTEQEKSSS